MGKKNKQKKKRNKKYMQKYTTGGRVDMRNGGRVRAQRGGQIPVAGTQPKPKKPIFIYFAVPQLSPFSTSTLRGTCKSTAFLIKCIASSKHFCLS